MWAKAIIWIPEHRFSHCLFSRKQELWGLKYAQVTIFERCGTGVGRHWSPFLSRKLGHWERQVRGTERGRWMTCRGDADFVRRELPTFEMLIHWFVYFTYLCLRCLWSMPFLMPLCFACAMFFLLTVTVCHFCLRSWCPHGLVTASCNSPGALLCGLCQTGTPTKPGGFAVLFVSHGFPVASYFRLRSVSKQKQVEKDRPWGDCLDVCRRGQWLYQLGCAAAHTFLLTWRQAQTFCQSRSFRADESKSAPWKVRHGRCGHVHALGPGLFAWLLLPQVARSVPYQPGGRSTSTTPWHEQLRV